MRMWRDSFMIVLQQCEKQNFFFWHMIWLILGCDKIHSWQDLFIGTWRMYKCDMTYLYVWHDFFLCVTSVLHSCDMAHSWVWHDSFTSVLQQCEERLVVSFFYVWYDSFLRVTRLIHAKKIHMYMMRLCVWHDLFLCVAWLIYMCDVTYLYVWHDLFLRMTRLFPGCENQASFWVEAQESFLLVPRLSDNSTPY